MSSLDVGVVGSSLIEDDDNKSNIWVWHLWSSTLDWVLTVEAYETVQTLFSYSTSL